MCIYKYISYIFITHKLFMIVQVKNMNESECGNDKARYYKSQSGIAHSTHKYKILNKVTW